MSETQPPLLLKPVYVAKLWGGRRLETVLGRTDLPDGPVGESWEAADTDAVCSLVDGGPHDGRPLREVLGQRFPLLLKVLDAREDLSVQLHPDGSDGGPVKEEAWVALADGGAVAVGDVREEIAAGRLPRSGAWLEHLERLDLRAGSSEGTVPPALVHVPPRTVHSILAGALLFEVQNPVDVTWRLDDFDRLGSDGRPRALHVTEARGALALGAEPARPLAGDGCRLEATRFSVELQSPGSTVRPRGRAAFFLESGALDWGPDGACFEVPAGRTVVLPTDLNALHSTGWVVTVDA